MGIYLIAIGATKDQPVHSYMVDAGNEQVAITRALQKDRRKINYPHVWLITCGRMKGKREDYDMRLKEVRVIDTTNDAESRLLERGDIINPPKKRS